MRCGHLNDIFDVLCSLYAGHPGGHYAEGIFWNSEEVEKVEKYLYEDIPEEE